MEAGTYYKLLKECILYVQEQLDNLSIVVVTFLLFMIVALIFVIIQNILLNQKIEKLIAVSDSKDPSQMTFDDLSNEKQPQKESSKKARKKKHRKVYVDAESTPLFFHKFLLFFSVPIGILLTLSNLFYNTFNSAYLSGYNLVNRYDISYATAYDLLDALELYQNACILVIIPWIVLCIFFIVGSVRWKPMGWISINIMLLYNIFADLSFIFFTEAIFTEYPFYYKTLPTVTLWGEFGASIVYAIPVFIYYKKRKLLFYPDLVKKASEEFTYETNYATHEWQSTPFSAPKNESSSAQVNNIISEESHNVFPFKFYTDVFDSFYSKICDEFYQSIFSIDSMNNNNYKAAIKNYEFELLPVLFIELYSSLRNSDNEDSEAISSVLGYHITDKYLRTYSNQVKFSERLSLYGEIIDERVDLRGEWLSGPLLNLMDVKSMRLIIAFGDILLNPECASIQNYSTAKARDGCFVFTDLYFTELIVKKILPLIADMKKQVADKH